MPEILRDRDELLLNAIATGDTTDIDPRDREEKFLKAIADKIGSSGSGGKTYVHLTVCRCVFGGANTTVVFHSLTKTDTAFTSISDLVSAYDTILEYHIQAGNVPYLFYHISKISKQSGTTIRVYLEYISQDADTKEVTNSDTYSDITLFLNDTVTEV